MGNAATSRRSAATSQGQVRVEIVGADLPGRRCGPDLQGQWYENVQVGIARGRDTVELVPGDAPRARWSFDVDLRAGEADEIDFGGPFVLGLRGERHLGLRWLRETAAGELVVFRAAKFRLFEMEPAIFLEARRSGQRLVGRLGLSDEQGWPRCATVRPPTIDWALEP